MVDQENPYIKQARENGLTMGLQGEALDSYVVGVLGASSLLLDINPEEVQAGGATDDVNGDQASLNSYTDIDFQQANGETIFVYSPPLDSVTIVEDASVQQKSTQSEKPIIPWSRPTKSGLPKGPGSNARKKAGLRKEIAQQRMLEDQRKKDTKLRGHKIKND